MAVIGVGGHHGLKRPWTGGGNELVASRMTVDRRDGACRMDKCVVASLVQDNTS
jgi:hypothetical protein